MADKGVTIIIKKKKGGAHGHHGGAWKVAYADFVTAMMAFFLVMWLLGADEETKSSIEQYFKNPSSPWNVNLVADDTSPLGNRTAAGDDVLKGQNGMVPEDLMEQPSEQLRQNVGTRDLEALSQEEDKVPAVDFDIEILRFKLRENELFEGETMKLTKAGRARLFKVADLMKTFKGKVVVKGFTEPYPGKARGVDSYEFATGRSVAVMNYFLENRIIDQSRIQTRVVNSFPKRMPASQFRGQTAKNDVRMVEISFSKDD